MTDSYLRRTVLAIAGGITLGTAGAKADHDDEQTTTTTQTQTQTTTTRTEDEHDHDHEKKVYTGYVEATNKADCQRQVYIDTSEQVFDLQLSPGETKCAWIEGNIQRLEIEPGAVEVDIRQPPTNDADDSCHH